MPQYILVVDDDHGVAQTVERTLTMEGYRVSVAYDGHDGLLRARESPPDLAILDVVMPGMNGFELCQRMRTTPGLSTVPVLFLTARQEISDKAKGFSAGADDYLTKPFDIRELVLRVRALLRRAAMPSQGSQVKELITSQLRLDRRQFTLTTPERTVLLTPVEFDLLSFLMSHPGEVFPPEKLLQSVWGYPPGAGSSDLVRVHVKNLREKIEPDPSVPRYILTISRHGYTIGE